MNWRDEAMEQRSRSTEPLIWRPYFIHPNTFLTSMEVQRATTCCTAAGFPPYATPPVCLPNIEASIFSIPMQTLVDHPTSFVVDVSSGHANEWNMSQFPSQEAVQRRMIEIGNCRRFQSRSFTHPVEEPPFSYIDRTSLGVRPACSDGRQSFEAIQPYSRGSEVESFSNPEFTLARHSQQDLASCRSCSSGTAVQDSAGCESRLYEWRKYGQKVAKGAEYPRRYYRCKSWNCPALKTEEQKYATGSTAIVYKNEHDHAPSSPGPTGIYFQGNMDILPPVTSSPLIPVGDRIAGILDNANEGVRSGQKEVDSRLSVKGTCLLRKSGRPRISGKWERTAVGVRTSFTGDVAQEVRQGVEKEREKTRFVMRDADVDGFCWRKYGEKRVGNEVKRSYYRCANQIDKDKVCREVCEARKQIETRVTESGNVTVRYRGRHNHRSLLKRVVMLACPSTSTIEATRIEQQYDLVSDQSKDATCEIIEVESQWDLDAFMSSDIQLDTAFIDALDILRRNDR